MPMNAAKQNTSETQGKKAGYQKTTKKSKRVMKQRIASIKSISAKEITPPHFFFSLVVNSSIENEILRQLVLPCIAMHPSYVSKKKKATKHTTFLFVKKVGFLNKRMSLPEIGRSQFEEVKK